MKKIFLVFVAMIEIAPPIFAQTFEEKLSQMGIVKEEQRNWSDSVTIEIPQPNSAYVNITSNEGMPTTKNDNFQAYMDVYDCNGNYFRKRIILNAQGNSSLGFVKKNFAVDFCEDKWGGDETTSISIGDWVSQDSYHFKAYYTDYFRGVATIGYKLYDQISSDRGRLWERAPEGSIKGKDKNVKAKCHPDGFPAIVYLNGEFYGVFSWQLKKHRDNMNMKKGTATHIHIDGDLWQNNIWTGTIAWTEFEVRNPKTLYTMDGNKYDGDNPLELIDETSEYFDLDTDDEKVKKNKQLTATVKQALITLSTYHNQLKAMESDGLLADAMRSIIETYFDVPGIIDYCVFHYVVNNYDGFGKNWQWFTYDGVKWFVAPYDLDGIFGGHATGYFTLPAEMFNTSYRYTHIPTTGPVYWIKKYYWEDIKARYAELRDKGVLSTENMYSLVENWYYRVMESNYNAEWLKWPKSYCIGETVCRDNWSTSEDWLEYSSLPDYSSAMTYYAGDKCRYLYRVWTATGETTGVSPCAKIGYHDSLERIHNWIANRIELIDDYLAYTVPAEKLMSYTLQVSNAEWATLCVPFSFDIPNGLNVYTITGMRGENTQLEKEKVELQTEANKPYLINGTPGYYNLAGYAEVADESDEENYLVNRLLHGTYSTKTAPVGSYVLQNQNGRLGFYLVSTDDILVLANRSWLALPVNKAPRNALFFSDDTPTAIKEVNSDNCNSQFTVYNICGRKLQNVQKGMNIVKGGSGNVTKIIKN